MSENEQKPLDRRSALKLLLGIPIIAGTAGGMLGGSLGANPSGGNGADEKVKITSSDTIADFLNPKIDAGTGITKSVINPGANEQVRLSSHLRLHNILNSLDHSDTITGTPAQGDMILADGTPPKWTRLSPPITGKILGFDTSNGIPEWQDQIFSKGGTVLNPTVINIIIWRASFICTVTAIKGYRVGGTGASINARKNGTSNHLSADLSISATDSWVDGGVVQNTAYGVGDKLEIMITILAGSPTQVAIQVDFRRP